MAKDKEVKGKEQPKKPDWPNDTEKFRVGLDKDEK